MVSAMVSIDCWHASDGQDVSGVHKDTVCVENGAVHWSLIALVACGFILP
jgi:hypothetical protein